AAPGVMPESAEGAAHHAGILAGDQDSHRTYLHFRPVLTLLAMGRKPHPSRPATLGRRTPWSPCFTRAAQKPRATATRLKALLRYSVTSFLRSIRMLAQA